MITIEHLGEKWFENEWNEKTHNGKYRTNQVEQHDEIMNKIFDLVLEYKDTDNPLSNFLILLNNEKSWYRSRRFAGRMADLSDEEIENLRKEFFICHDYNGHIRAEFVPEPGKSWGTLKPGTSVSAFYIVQGTNPNRFNRHDMAHWDFPHDIETPICSTKEDFKAMERELFIHGFGNYNVWGKNSDDPITVYELYDMTDEEFTQGDKVRFIRVFEHISDDNIPLLFLHEETEDRRNEGEMVRELEVDNGFSFGRGVLGYTRSCGCEPNINKVPQDILDKYLKIVERYPITKNVGKTMNVGEDENGDPKTISMEKKGEFVFIEGIAEKQKKCLREKIEFYLKDNSYSSYTDEQLEGLAKFLGIGKKEPEVVKYDKESDMLSAFAAMISKNPPKFDEEYETFMTDLMQKPDNKSRRYIKARAEQKYYHDFESQLAGPKMALAEDLKAAGFDDMVTKTYQGDYDF